MFVCVPCLDIPALSSQQGGHTVCCVSLRLELCVLKLKINSTYIPSSHPGDFWKIRASEGHKKIQRNETAMQEAAMMVKTHNSIWKETGISVSEILLRI